MENMDKGLTVPKWVLIVWLKITHNAPEFICPICLPKPKSSGFQWKKPSLGGRSPCTLVPNLVLKSLSYSLSLLFSIQAHQELNVFCLLNRASFKFEIKLHVKETNILLCFFSLLPSIKGLESSSDNYLSLLWFEFGWLECNPWLFLFLNYVDWKTSTTKKEQRR